MGKITAANKPLKEAVQAAVDTYRRVRAAPFLEDCILSF
jgi:hypothetical protein